MENSNLSLKAKWIIKNLEKNFRIIEKLGPREKSELESQGYEVKLARKSNIIGNDYHWYYVERGNE